jgi:hypothetical protein
VAIALATAVGGIERHPQPHLVVVEHLGDDAQFAGGGTGRDELCGDLGAGLGTTWKEQAYELFSKA